MKYPQRERVRQITPPSDHRADMLNTQLKVQTANQVASSLQSAEYSIPPYDMYCYHPAGKCNLLNESNICANFRQLDYGDSPHFTYVLLPPAT